MLYWHDTPWMWLSMLAFWSLFVVFAYYAIKGLTDPTAAHGAPKATEILDERYARGEISVEEYRERRESLETAGAKRS